MVEFEPNTWRGFAPGKLILAGEHAVVYGHPAIAIAVDRGTTVTLKNHSGPTTWTALADDARLGRAMRAVLPAEGLNVSIESDLLIGRGMGSSAALAISLTRAMMAREGHEPTFAELHARGFVIERVFHGDPSGVDHAVSALGGGVQYQRTKSGPPGIVPIALPDLQFVVLDSGTSGNTAELVAGVRKRGDWDTIHAIGQLSARIGAALGHGIPPAQLGPMLTENHQLLCQLGVSTDGLDTLVDVACDAGAWGAKMAGAGGGGVVVALVDTPQTVLQAALSRGINAFGVGIHPQQR